MTFCKVCGHSKLVKIEQIFKDETKHIRLQCAKCDSFNGYAKQYSGYNKIIVKDHIIKSERDHKDLLWIIDDQLSHQDLFNKEVTVVIKVRG